MLQLPSLQRVLQAAGRVARRFPLTLLCAGVVCVAGCQAIAFNTYPDTPAAWVFPLLSAGALGLPLTLALALAAERYGWAATGRWAAQAGALALLAGWYALAPAAPGLVWGLRLAVLLLGLHLAVAAAPYLGELRRGADPPGFWRYNQTLFQRLLLAGLYSGVLYVGCAIALLALRELFGWDTNSDWFGFLFVALASLFNTWFFLAGVPADFAALEQEAPYPQGLKVFTQFVLLPLVVLYGGILYAYLGRIVVQWSLPKGWVSVLILALAVAGIFALLLIHPLRQSPDNTWIRTFARWFYRALFPLLGLLAVAIGTRVHAYGLTEERYFVLLLAAWLLGIALYFLVRQGQGIVWIPVSLAGLALGSVAGPWGAFAVAERSQLHELHALASRYHLLQNGHLDGANGRVPNLPRAVRGAAGHDGRAPGVDPLTYRREAAKAGCERAEGGLAALDAGDGCDADPRPGRARLFRPRAERRYRPLRILYLQSNPHGRDGEAERNRPAGIRGGLEGTGAAEGPDLDEGPGRDHGQRAPAARYDAAPPRCGLA